MHVVIALIAVTALAYTGYRMYCYVESKLKPTAAVVETPISPAATTGGSSAFEKVANAYEKQKAAQGKLLALKAATEAKQAAADALKAESLVIHAGLDKAHESFDEVHKILG